MGALLQWESRCRAGRCAGAHLGGRRERRCGAAGGAGGTPTGGRTATAHESRKLGMEDRNLCRGGPVRVGTAAGTVRAGDVHVRTVMSEQGGPMQDALCLVGAARAILIL